MEEKCIKLVKVRDGDMQSDLYAEEISPETFRLLENHLFNYNLTYGTIIKTAIRDEAPEFLSIQSKSPYVTKRYLLDRKFSSEEWTEVTKILDEGGYSEVSMGGIFIVNLVSEFQLVRFLELVRSYGIVPVEFVDGPS